jgi:large subunit ribosomal protein L29
MVAIMKFAELVSKTESELHQLCGDLKKEMLNLRVQAKVNQSVNVSRFRQCRRDIARINTRLKQMKSA